MDNALVKQMPVAIEAEQALLGSLIINPKCFELIGGMIKASDFYLLEHQHIFSAIERMFNTSRTVDVVTLVNALVEMGDKDQNSGIQYLAMISQSVPSSENVVDYAKIVKEKSLLRTLIGVCDEISADAYDESSPVRQIIDSAEQKIFDLTHGNATREFRHIRDILQNVYQELEIKSDQKGEDPKNIR